MAPRAAIVTGASSGIGLSLARLLAREGYAVTMAARRADKLQAAHDELAAEGLDVQQIAVDLGREDAVAAVVGAHRDAYGRLDVLVNNAGVGIGAPVGELQTKFLDIQINTNLRSITLFYRESLDLLRAAGAEHGNALVVNMSSISGKRGEPWLNVYSATKAAVVGWTESMNKELNPEGIKSTALCPAFVDTPMSDFVKGHLAPERMIQTSDIDAAVRMLLALTPGCVIPEILFEPPGGQLGLPESPSA